MWGDIVKRKTDWGFVVITVIVAVITVFLFFNYSVDKEIYKDAVFLNDKWQVQVNDEISDGVDLEKFSFSSTVRGDKITYRRALPEVDMLAPCLRIYSSHCLVEVYLDGELIYSFGSERSEKGKMLGGGYHWIALPDNFQNKELTIVYEARENSKFSSLYTPVLQGGNNALADFVKENRLAVYIGVFLIVFGCGSFVLSVFLVHFQKELHNLLCISLFSFCVGLWNICNAGVIQVVSSDMYKNALLEYMSLYLGTIPIMLFYWEVKKEYKALRTAFRGLLAINMIFPVVTCILHLFNVVHMCAMLSIFYIILACDIAWGIFISVRKMKSQKLYEKVLLFGIGSMSVFVVADVMLFNLQKFGTHLPFSEVKCLSAIGALLLIISLVVSYCLRIIANYFGKAEREILEKLAFSDALTGLSNRQRFDHEMSQIRINKVPYVMIIFDLNNLKYANDTWGHSEGDQLICCFADCLKTSMGEYGLVARTGGDEFAALLMERDVDFVERQLCKLLSSMQSINEQERIKVKLSTAYGMASSEECAGVDDAYKLADNRMYAMKQKMKRDNLELHIR